MTAGAYQASPIKRHRATKAEVEHRRDAALRHRRGDEADDGAPGVLPGHRPRHRREDRGRLHQGADRPRADAPGRRAALRLARRQHPLAAQAAHLRQHRGRRSTTTARFYRKASGTDADCYVEIWLEKDALAGVVYPGHLHVRRAADGGARLRQPVVPAQRRRVHQRARGPDLHLPPRRLRSVRRQRRREDRGDAARDWRPTPRSTSSGSPSRRSRSRRGTCRPGRPRRATAGPRASATSRSSSTRSSRAFCGPSCRRRSSGTCRPVSSRS